MIKYTTEDARKCYEDVLNGVSCSFPFRIWVTDETRQLAVTCTRYLFDKILKVEPKEIYNLPLKRVFIRYKLFGMVCEVYNGNIIEAVADAYTEEELGVSKIVKKKKYWNTKEDVINAVRDLYTKVYPYDEEFIKNNHCRAFLEEHGLRTVMSKYKYTALELVEMAFPNTFKPYEFKKMNIHWSKELIAIAVRELIRDLKLTKQQVYEQFGYTLLNKHNFGGIIRKCSAFEALDLAFPGEYDELIYKRYHQRGTTRRKKKSQEK